MRHSRSTGRAGLSRDLEVLADRAVQRGSVKRANDLRAIAEHLRAKEAETIVLRLEPPRRPHRARRLRRLLGRLRRRRSTTG